MTAAAPSVSGPGRLRSWATGRPLFALALVGLTVAALVPIWLPRLLPLGDLPEQLAALAIRHRLGDPSWSYERFYEPARTFAPGAAWWLPVTALSYLMPVEVASKVYLSLYAAALPLAVARLARRMGRSPWLAVFSFPLVWSATLARGQVAWCAGTAVLLFALEAFDEVVAAPSLMAGILVMLGAVALPLFHPALWVFFAVVAIFWLFGHGFRPRRVAAAAVLLLPSVVLIGVALRSGAIPLFGADETGGRPATALAALQALPVSIVMAWAGDHAYRLLVALGALWLLFLVSGVRAAPEPDRESEDENGAGEPTPSGARYRLEIATALAGLAIFFVGPLFVPLFALFALLLPQGRRLGTRWLLLIPAVALAALLPLELGRAFARFDGRAQVARRLLASVPLGASVLVLAADGTDPALDPRSTPWRAFHAYAPLWIGGIDPWLSRRAPVRVRPERALPAPERDHPEAFRFEQHGLYWDYLLTRGEAAPFALVGPNVGQTVALVEEVGELRLYRVSRP